MKKKKELPQVEPVKIKPLFGMKPGLWLTIAYALAILLILFLVGVLPDLINGSKRVTFTSAAYNAAVYIDDEYAGGTPFTKRVESGTHNVVYKVNDCEIDSFTLKVGHPFFFNWLFPRTQQVESSATLTQEAFTALSKELLEDANLYSAILEYDDVHRYSPIFTTYAKCIKGSSYESQTQAFETALLFISTQEMYDDAKEALEILGLNITLDASKLFEESSSTIGIAHDENQTVTAKATTLDAGVFTISGFNIPETTFSNGNEVECTYPQVKEAGQEVTVQSFNVSGLCITENQWAYFVNENPDWSLSNKDNLIEQGLVDDYYLDGVTLSMTVASNKPVKNISWYAAEAFCSWLSEKTGKNVSLPTENQWIAATLSDTEGGFQKSLMPSVNENCPSALLGGLWEFTSTPYIPLSRLVSASQSNQAVSVLESLDVQASMIVKGGSYVNVASEVNAYTVGTAYRSLCSDFTGFRVVWN